MQPMIKKKKKKGKKEKKRHTTPQSLYQIAYTNPTKMLDQLLLYLIPVNRDLFNTNKQSLKNI